MKSARQTKGKLLLIPNLISEEAVSISDEVRSAIQSTRIFLAETPKSARKFLRKVDPSIKLESLDIKSYDKNTSRRDLEQMLTPLQNGSDIGVITDSGIPGIADPGSSAVAIAHQWQVQVKPYAGASSIFMALAASGFTGQQFCFHGYLPVQSRDCISKLKKIENDSRKNDSSQIFIETPYRNGKLFQLLLKNLHPDTRLCVACDITGASETILSKSISEWQRVNYAPGKVPCVFILYSGS